MFNFLDAQKPVTCYLTLTSKGGKQGSLFVLVLPGQLRQETHDILSLCDALLAAGHGRAFNLKMAAISGALITKEASCETSLILYVRSLIYLAFSTARRRAWMKSAELRTAWPPSLAIHSGRAGWPSTGEVSMSSTSSAVLPFKKASKSLSAFV